MGHTYEIIEPTDVYDEDRGWRSYDRVCHVYVIRRPDTHEIKIGISLDPAKRLASHQSSHARPLELLLSFAGGEPAERALLARFAGHRLNGEWFRECPEILQWIERQRAHLSRP